MARDRAAIPIQSYFSLHTNSTGQCMTGKEEANRVKLRSTLRGKVTSTTPSGLRGNYPCARSLALTLRAMTRFPRAHAIGNWEMMHVRITALLSSSILLCALSSACTEQPGRDQQKSLGENREMHACGAD